MPSPSSATTKRSKVKPRNELRSLQILGEPSGALFPSRKEILKVLLVVFIAGSVAAACNFLSNVINRRPKPFCDSSDASQDLVNIYLPVAMAGLQEATSVDTPMELNGKLHKEEGDLLIQSILDIDICFPCPEKGWCFNGELKCLHGYEKQGRICVENAQLHQTTKIFVKLVEHHVCDSYALVLCGRAGKIWFEEGDVMKILDDQKARVDIHLEDDFYKLAVHKALETVQGSLEMKADSNMSYEYKCPELQAEHHKPLDCCIRQWFYRHILLVTGVLTIVSWLTWFVWLFHKKQVFCTRAEKLYEEVCEILEDKAMIARTKNEGEPWVVASWLRDHLLLPRERKDSKLWKKVEGLIQADSRIDQYPKLIKGESKIVLEWQVDGALSSKMRAKKTVNKTTKFGSQVDRYPVNQEKAKVVESQFAKP